MSVKLQSTVVDTYWEKGWAVVENVFTAEEAERVAELALAQVDEELTARTGGLADRADDGEAIAPRKINQPFLMHAAFREFVLDERLTGILERLLGKPPLLTSDQIFLKPPRHGSAKPYHQDNAYFRCDPADEVITAWIALDDVDERNGCLRYIDGSHRLPILPHQPVEGETHNITPDPSLIDLSLESLAPVKKGGVVFHHVNVLHTSHRNRSNRWRRGYATHWVTADVRSQSQVLEKAYYKNKKYFKTLSKA